ncbi:hypothetical protein CYMTET_34956 [Cymbomonas tetramitiformis]|uniref:Superoxide dismutase copper/zinc binding domain-containing protein n=1 Tax=Cymbomonas tetramitiformis TaxID=36881 RepID=A0AAE0KPG5_9CHLO|nr:hypothetical protein CYMTET_34956 [Cymbomonas tetramitiformis]
MVASISEFQDYIDLSPHIEGTVNLTQASDTAITITYELFGLPSEEEGTIAVHEGHTCDNAGGDYYRSSSDPWTETYSADVYGYANGSFTVETGYPYQNNSGHVVVVDDGAHEPLGCGGLVEQAYGLHVHEGTTCSNADDVGGHYYSTENDTWTGPYATYVPDGYGNAKGTFMILTGYSCFSSSDYGPETYTANDYYQDHAVVVHGEEDVRLGCGLLSTVLTSDYSDYFDTSVITDEATEAISSSDAGSSATTGCPYEASIGRYPGYEGEYTRISGPVSVGQALLGSDYLISEYIQVTYNLTGAQQGKMVASIREFQDYIDLSPHIEGTVNLTQASDTAITITYELFGLPSEEEGTIAVHEGHTCDNAGGDYYRSSSDPWTETYSADVYGYANGSFTVETGYPYQNNSGHVVVVDDGAHEPLGCGGLVEQAYGLHVHEGTTCSNADDVGGHYYSTENDTWTGPYATYVPDGYGNAKGTFMILTGYSCFSSSDYGPETYTANDYYQDHAVVVHGEEDVRLGCGLLSTVLTSDYSDYSAITDEATEDNSSSDAESSGSSTTGGTSSSNASSTTTDDSDSSSDYSEDSSVSTDVEDAVPPSEYTDVSSDYSMSHDVEYSVNPFSDYSTISDDTTSHYNSTNSSSTNSSSSDTSSEDGTSDSDSGDDDDAEDDMMKIIFGVTLLSFIPIIGVCLYLRKPRVTAEEEHERMLQKQMDEDISMSKLKESTRRATMNLQHGVAGTGCSAPRPTGAAGWGRGCLAG